MMAPVRGSLNITVIPIVESPDAPAAQTLPGAVLASPDDIDILVKTVEANTPAVVTFEHEHISPHTLRMLGDIADVRPGAQALRYAQDKLAMRQRLSELWSSEGRKIAEIPLPRWRRCETVEEIDSFADEVGWPMVAKTPRGGYDGHGVRVIDTAAEVSDWLERGAILAEERVNYRCEIAALVARRPSGDIQCWPVVETIQRNGICTEVIVPAPNVSAELAKQAQHIAENTARALDVTGVMAVEMFVVGERLLINELAMRPHNCGHWTIEGSPTSQFTQHLRAVLDWPLGPTAALPGTWVMRNVLGTQLDDLSDAVPRALDECPGINIHLYGKAPRPGRKLGHVTANAPTVDEARDLAARAVAILQGMDITDNDEGNTA